MVHHWVGFIDLEQIGGGFYEQCREKNDVDPETLEGGKILRYLVKRFLDGNSNTKYYMDALSCLRDSQVVIPGIVSMSDADFQAFRNAKTGDVISLNEKTGFVPDIIESGGQPCLPVFSNPEQMGKEYCENSSMVTMDFLDALEIAASREYLSGIMLDARTVPFYVPKNLFELVRSLPSRLDPAKTSKKLKIHYVKGAPAELAKFKLSTDRSEIAKTDLEKKKLTVRRQNTMPGKSAQVSIHEFDCPRTKMPQEKPFTPDLFTSDPRPLSSFPPPRKLSTQEERVLKELKRSRTTSYPDSKKTTPMAMSVAGEFFKVVFVGVFLAFKYIFIAVSVIITVGCMLCAGKQTTGLR